MTTRGRLVIIADMSPWGTAVNDIRRAFEAYPQTDAGLIFSTGASVSPELDAAIEKLRKDFNKPVTLLVGADSALRRAVALARPAGVRRRKGPLVDQVSSQHGLRRRREQSLRGEDPTLDRTIAITGATGVGKTFVACALAQHALRRRGL